MATALLNYIFNRKKGTPEEVTQISDVTRLVYLTSEFESIGDMTRDKYLRLEEFVRLMKLLGYPGDDEEIEKIWKFRADHDQGHLTLEDYFALMEDEVIRSKTDMWRKLFAQFDRDGNGFATKAEIVQGLENIGMDVTPEIRGKLEAMDANQDGKISYGEFLKQQLSQE